MNEAYTRRDYGELEWGEVRASTTEPACLYKTALPGRYLCHHTDTAEQRPPEALDESSVKPGTVPTPSVDGSARCMWLLASAVGGWRIW